MFKKKNPQKIDNEIKISIKCKCGQISEFADKTEEPIEVTGRPKIIIDSNCIICGREIKAYVLLQNERNLFK